MDWPWKALAPVDRRREYLALPSYLPLRKCCKIPRFLPFTRQIQRQLHSTPGAIGYCMRAKLLCCKFWTLSVWENERALASQRGATKLTQGKIRGSASPSDGDQATRRELQES